MGHAPLDRRPLTKEVEMVLLKRLFLVFYGPLAFIYIGLAPVFCGKKRGFRNWYWNEMKRALRFLLDLLDITVSIDEQSLQALSQDSGSVLAVNHKSHLDVIALLSVMPPEKWLTFAPKIELYRLPFFARGFEDAGCIPIDRRKGRDTLRMLIEAVGAKPRRVSLVLFPEGTRWRPPGIGPFKAGVMLVAKAHGLAVRPVCIVNSDRLLPPGRFIPTSGVIRIVVLPPFHPDEGPVDANLKRLRAQMSDAYERALLATPG